MLSFHDYSDMSYKNFYGHIEKVELPPLVKKRRQWKKKKKKKTKKEERKKRKKGGKQRKESELFWTVVFVKKTCDFVLH